MPLQTGPSPSRATPAFPLWALCLSGALLLCLCLTLAVSLFFPLSEGGRTPSVQPGARSPARPLAEPSPPGQGPSGKGAAPRSITFAKPALGPIAKGPALLQARRLALTHRNAAEAHVGALLVAPDPAWGPLLQCLEADGFDKTRLFSQFARLGPDSYSPSYMAAKITELYGVGGIGIKRDEETGPKQPPGYCRPLADITVGSCLAFIKEYAEEFAAIKKRHGVDASVIIGLLLVETGLGLDLGKDAALGALAGMAATTTPELLAGSGNGRQAARIRPAALAATLKEKSDWAYSELKAFLAYTQSGTHDACTLPGSIYGAIGICQFMPSNIERFAVDGDKDGRIDLFSVVDAMYSVANYLEAHGWRAAKSQQQRLAVIYAYNHDMGYAAQVLASAAQVERGLKGKASPKSNALVGGYGRNPSARLDPSLRRGRPVPRHARVQTLGDYQNALQ